MRLKSPSLHRARGADLPRAVGSLRYDPPMLIKAPPIESLAARAGCGLAMRSLDGDDVDEVKRILVALPVDYPGGDQWLERRLVDVLDGRATCELATLGGRVVGLTIGTPKGQATKLSTIYVVPTARRVGVASALLDSFIAQACSNGDREIYVTAAHHRWPELQRLFESRGFIVSAVEFDRYGPGRHEVVAIRVTP